MPAGWAPALLICPATQAQALEDALQMLLDVARVPPDEDMPAAVDFAYRGTLHLHHLERQWVAQRDLLTPVHLRHLEAALEEGRSAIDGRQRSAALHHLRAAVEAAREHLTTPFTRGRPCLPAAPLLTAAVAEAERWLTHLAWVDLQRKVWIGLGHALAVAVQSNAEGAGRERHDITRAQTRDTLARTLQDADRLLQQVPPEALHSKDHMSLEGQARRGTAMLAELERYWGAELEARMAVRRWTPSHECTTCRACDRPFGWLRWRYHCHKCGDVFCYRCLPWRKALPSLAFSDPVPVCEGCYAGSPLMGPKPPLPEALRDALQPADAKKLHRASLSLPF